MRSRAAGAGVLAITLTLLGVPGWTPSASAAPSSADLTVTYRCATTLFGVAYEAEPADYRIRLTTATEASRGSLATVTWERTSDVGPALPVALAAVAVRTTVALDVTYGDGIKNIVTGTGITTEPVDVDPYEALPIARDLTLGFAVDAPVGSVITVLPGVVRAEFTTVLPSDAGEANSSTVNGSLECTPETADGAVSGKGATIAVTAPALTAARSSAAAQSIIGAPTYGNLQQDVAVAGSNPNSTTIQFGTVTSMKTASLLTAPLNTIQVSDQRSGAWGWSLTARLSGPLTTSDGGSIPASLVTVTPTCNEAPEVEGLSAPWSTGTTGALNTSVMLCSVAQGTVGLYGTGYGIYNIDGSVTLSVPPFAKAGNYYGVLDVTLA